MPRLLLATAQSQMGIKLEDERKRTTSRKKSRNRGLMLLTIKKGKDSEDDKDDAHQFKDPDKGASLNNVENGSVIEDRQKTQPTGISASKI